jgi:uncharacterized protein (DUF302 family)
MPRTPKALVAAILGIWFSGVGAMAAEGLVTVPSSFGPRDTMDKFEAAVKATGLTVFARIDHAEGAVEVGMKLPPTELLVFGNARGGTPLMQANQATGIDLPLKALVYKDETRKVWLSYNDPHWIAQRHGLGASHNTAVDAMASLLKDLAAEATR